MTPVKKLSQRSQMARRHLSDAIRTASGLPRSREENELCKKQMLIGVRFTLTLLGVSPEGLYHRFVMEQFQAWVRTHERGVAAIANVHARKGPQRASAPAAKGRRRG